MCNSIMRCKTRLLFVCIVISFLVGSLSKAYLYTSENTKMSVGAIAETSSICNPILDSVEDILSESYSETHVGDALRHFSQTKRISNPSSFRYVLTFTQKRNHQYTSTQLLEFFRRFPSCLIEVKQYLISLGRLII